MVSLASKSLLGLAFAAAVAAVSYGIATNEASGTMALAFAALGAAALASVAQAAGTDIPPAPATAGPAVHNRPAGGRAMIPSVWPALAALAIGGLVVAAATSLLVLVAAFVALSLVGIGWLIQAWTEHPRFTARFGARLNDRLLVPLALPVGVAALVALIALSLSRILLAVSEQGSRVVAIAVAVVVLAGAFFVANQPRIGRAALGVLSAIALLAVVVAGGIGLATGMRHFEAAGASSLPPASISLSASNAVSFDTSALSAPAGRPLTLQFDNATAGVPHNVGIFDKPGGRELFAGAIVVGPKLVTYHVPALAAGAYFFHCDVHPNMNGTLTVAPDSGAPTGATASSPSTTAPAAASSGTPPTTALVTAGYATSG